jgi:ribonuclease D
MNYQLITDDQALNSLCNQLQQCKWLAVDTEFMRQDTFFAQLAMVQIATPTLDVYLIDPLSINNLNSLWSLLANQAVLKVFHAARQDLEVLFQQADRMPSPIFDTQLAGVFLGLGDQAGYARLVEHLCNEKLNKDQARTPWLERPLNAEQLAYAAADVWFLAQAYPKIIRQLTPTQRQALETDFHAISNPELYQINPEQAWLRIKFSSGLSPKQNALLRQITAWRETQAVSSNQPRKWIISDDAILQLAKRPVREVQDLYKLRQFDGELIRHHGETLIQIIDHTLQNPETWPSLTPNKALTSEQQTIMTILQAISQQVAQEQGIHLPNLANKQELTALLLNQPSQLNQGWRYLILGKMLGQFIKGQLHLRIDNKTQPQHPKLLLTNPNQ